MVENQVKKSLEWNEQDVGIVRTLSSEGIALTDLARSILNNSTHLKEMGLIIFFDRYSVKARDELEVGDLVVAISMVASRSERDRDD